MIGFDGQVVRLWLLGHGVRLRPPAPLCLIAEMKAAFARPIHPDIVKMYRAFDGCEELDFEVDSMITIWPIEHALKYLREQADEDRLGFADRYFAADIAVCSVLEPDGPVAWADGSFPPNRSFAEFWAQFMRGRFG